MDNSSLVQAYIDEKIVKIRHKQNLLFDEVLQRLDRDLANAVVDTNLSLDELTQSYEIISATLEAWDTFLVRMHMSLTEVTKNGVDVKAFKKLVDNVICCPEPSKENGRKAIVENGSTVPEPEKTPANESESQPVVETPSLSNNHSLSRKRSVPTLPSYLRKGLKIPPPDVSLLEEKFFGTVSHVVSPSEFYVHVGENDKSVEKWQIKLNNYYENHPETIQLDDNSLNQLKGTYWAALFPDDEKWYRVMVTDILQDVSENNIQVYYVDYGNSCMISKNQIRPLVTSASTVSAMAFKCQLSSLKPSHPSGQWSSDNIAYFENATCGMKLTVTLDEIPVSMNDNSILSVDLHNGEEVDEDCTVRQCLIEQGMASSVYETSVATNNGTPSASQTKISEPEAYVELSDDEDDRITKAQNPIAAFIGYEPTEEKLVCRYFLTKNGCSKGTRCDFKHVANQAPLVSAIEEQIYQPFEEKLIVGLNYAVHISIHEVRQIFAILPLGHEPLSDEKIECMRKDDIKASTFHRLSKYKDLRDDMKSFYANEVENCNTFPCIGSLVAVFKSGNFNRCRVICSNVEDNSVDAECIDTGALFDRVSRKFVFSLKSQFTELPCLGNRMLLSPKHSDQVIGQMQGVLINNTFVAKVIDRSPDGVLEVTLAKLKK
ncbi:Tudor domain-containing protein 1 [Halotydeus destructor]|nr:Tudor domain-containing protein 1 [Halotydeus destructor]